jgi:cytochrome P450
MTEWSPKHAWQDVEADAVQTASDAYTSARQSCPVVRVPDGDGPGFWAILGHAEVVRVVGDPEAFSNVVPLYPTPRPPLESDPPEHTAYRRILAGHFSAGRTAALEPVVRDFAVQMLDPLLAAGEADFVPRFTNPLPTRVLCALLGIPDADWPLINDMAARLHRTGADRRDDVQARAGLGSELRGYTLDLIAARRGQPHDDLIGGLLVASVNGTPLTDDEVTGIVMMLISAGHNTTTSLLGNALLRLARDSAEQDRLRSDPAAIPAAVEEMLRIDAPQQAMPRVATRDVELAGCHLRAGDHVWPVFGAANLDPAAFDDPGTYQPDRRPNRHLAFGRGLHRCIGAPLAQLQGRVVLEEVLSRTSSFTLAGQISRTNWPRLGVSSLPLRTTAR